VKVVIFCGGLGVRMGEETQRIPKPMIRIGNRPILWHLMSWYASWGHRDFVLCLGYKAEVIKEYFLQYNEMLFNDFVLESDGESTHMELLSRDVGGWRITFADTGVNSTIGERLKAVEHYLGDDEEFLATYGDGLTDAPLGDVIDAFHRGGKQAMLLSVRPEYHAHIVQSDGSGAVVGVEEMSQSAVRINAGFFVLKREVIDLIGPGEELVVEAFARLIERGELVAYPYDGFFGPMDTIKDRQRLEALHESGRAPWRVSVPGAASSLPREG
jgi:glucose-1-phosphate cytidylyltransferase